MTPGESRLHLPHALELLPRLRAGRDAAGHIFVGLDYDGTLTPIVARPGDAHLPDVARRVLERLAARRDTVLAILSGRALHDVRSRVAVEGAYYAGNHGLEIAGPGLDQLHPGAAAALPVLRAAAAELRRELAGVAGAEVEDKGASLSVHYRNVAEHAQPAVRHVALRTGQGRTGIRCTEGKLVVELRPDVDWHKGAALRFIRAALPSGAEGPAVFIGDDRTDEDGFRELAGGGWGIVVTETPAPETAARAWLRSPAEVVEWLDQLAL